ncbi:dihydropteroate synthase [Brevibacterium otitidis]|uniref:Dihydropteroate synthase n=1 Tax=Brevibacterium otitidis TaxID=53364 RepID=A0ABV5X7M3_9MICO|nr:dihydropteroate synthase [Brevibacterium otitidis]
MRTQIMGILNVTPDSFSDGGRWFDFRAAVDHGLELLAEGSDIIDIGGESTRPGSARVSAEEELRRVIPVIEELAGHGAVISIDTMRAAVARRALDAGAAIINDVSAGQAEAEMLTVAADAGVPIILMHWRGLLSDAGARFHYDDAVAEVQAELSERIDAARAAGVADDDIIIDPGIGFSKNAEHNWQLLAQIQRFTELGPRLLVAASRKRFLATLLGDGTAAEVSLADRDAATAALTMLSAQAGAWAVRVHEPRASRIAAQVAEALAAHRPQAAPLPLDLPENPAGASDAEHRPSWPT